MTTATITLRIDREHEARVIAAIRARKRQEALGEVEYRIPGWRRRDRSGRFARKAA